MGQIDVASLPALRNHPRLLSKALNFANHPEQVNMPTRDDFVNIVKLYNSKEDVEKPSQIDKAKIDNFAAILFEKIGHKWQERRGKDFAEDLLGKFKSNVPFGDNDELKKKLRENKNQAKPISKVLDDFVDKQDDITLNGAESVKQEFLEETPDARIKQEDQQEDGITVESIAEDNDEAEHEFEIGTIESDYNGSVASDNDEPEPGSANGLVKEDVEAPSMEVDETPSTLDNSDKDKEEVDQVANQNELESTREQFQCLLESVICE